MTFAGFGELLGAVLLFFRRTTTLGALVLIAVLSNVAMINYVYDVPVKQLSTNLLFASILLASLDLRRLLAVFVRNTPAMPADLSFPLSTIQRRLQSIIRPAIIGLAVIGPLAASYLLRRNSLSVRPPIYGVYDVVRFEHNGRELPPLATDSIRWRRATFSTGRTLSVRDMTDTAHTIHTSIDTATHRVTLKGTDAAHSGAVAYKRIGADSVVLAGRIGADSVVVLLKQLDVRRVFRLAQ